MSGDLGQIRNWLLKLSAFLTCPYRPAELETRISMLAGLAAVDFPPDAFCDRSLHAALSTLTFWPSYAELRAVLDPWWKEHRPDKPNRYALPELVYDRPVLPPERTPEELTHAERLVAKTAAALLSSALEREAAQRDNTPAWRRPAAEMTRAQLTEAYRRAGVKGPVIPPTLKAAATPIRHETKRGPPLDA